MVKLLIQIKQEMESSNEKRYKQEAKKSKKNINLLYYTDIFAAYNNCYASKAGSTRRDKGKNCY